MYYFTRDYIVKHWLFLLGLVGVGACCVYSAHWFLRDFVFLLIGLLLFVLNLVLVSLLLLHLHFLHILILNMRIDQSNVAKRRILVKSSVLDHGVPSLVDVYDLFTLSYMIDLVQLIQYLADVVENAFFQGVDYRL